ncbi:DEAD/DEAH box helicase [Haloquadratum walsbyi]|jgi:ERCC4-like helicases|uniref:ERCC4-like helicase n=1 Tax=Haloquadratum walsbyi J07HQW2 TaxID=1238425 RepID=U1MZL0_9EURY|nr:DEAD/DEAH box helicase [Haloquadratum walsbyi]ERG95944.1 MAG: ERCC4-like helicase [Haloquadratum walsbyi J07HQW2]
MAATDDPAYVDHPLLVSSFIEQRLYQLQLAETARETDTLVCLPTGLGKTTVSLLVTASRLNSVGGTALFLAPTKPLVRQHIEFYRNALTIPDEDIVVFTGEIPPHKRETLWDDAQIVIATPQVIENDLIGNRISLDSVTHLTFDECHRATGKYAYVYIAGRYHDDATNPRVTGMSASPGGDKEEIVTVCNNIGVSAVEVMTEGDADVDEYTYTTDVEWERIELPDDIIQIRDALNDVIRDRLQQLKSLGVSSTTQPDVSQKQLNKIRGKLQKLIDADNSDGYAGMSTHAEVMKLRRAVELVETQSVESVRQYFERQRNAAQSSGASKASQRLVAEPKVRQSMQLAESFDGTHPKFSHTRILLAQTLGIEGGERVIIFTESRDTVEALTEFLSASFDVQRFVGQNDTGRSDGMTQRQQQETLEAFRAGEFEVLVSTSVAEEGLDVPEVDLVLFFEPVPTAIRSIQRKGRTGRQTEGRVVVLLAEDTRDEAYFWISRRREKKMESELRSLKQSVDTIESSIVPPQEELTTYNHDQSTEMDTKASNTGADTTTKPDSDVSTQGVMNSDEDNQSGITDFAPSDAEVPSTDSKTQSAEEKNNDTGSTDTDTNTDVSKSPPTPDVDTDKDTIEIVVDQRELDSAVPKSLSTRNAVQTRLETLAVGDYVLSDRVAVERKSTTDFLDTLLDTDRSLFEQTGDLVRAYRRPVLMLEGELTALYSERNIEPRAIQGALASLAVDFDLSIVQTRDDSDTADMLETIATREQTSRDRSISVHGEKSAKTLQEQQEYVVSSIADIGPVTAQSLLDFFGTVEAVMIASENELTEVDGVGAVTAGRIRDIVGSDYS